MSESNHDFASEFPELKDAVHRLKVDNSHFRQLFERYHELNKAIHRSEQRTDAISDFEEEKLRKERLRVKDELYQMAQKG